ncbi:caspase family protein [Reichenbachiella sp. MALMAid0571]|uniref:caspase family protein n=1 Tax=Reichenbachiella sp. MALMAid0571 TaxID=3143939 RepID=UPI0032DE7037
MRCSYILIAWIFLSNAYAQDSSNEMDHPMVLKPSGHKGIVWDMSLTSDGKHIITAGQDKTVKIWDVENDFEQRGEILGYISSENYGSVYAARVSPNLKYIATTGFFGDRDHRKQIMDIRIYDYSTKKIIGILEGHADVMSALRWSADSRYLISASRDYSVRIWDIETQQLKVLLKGHGDQVNSADIFGNHVVTGSKDNLIMLWDINTGANMATSFDHLDQVRQVVFDPSGKYIISGGSDNQINIYNSSLQYMNGLSLKQTASAMSFSANGNYLLTGFNDGSVQVFEFSDGNLTEIATTKSHTGGFVAGVVMTKNNQIISVGGADGNLVVSQFIDGKMKEIMRKTPSNQKVWGASLNGDLMVFSTESESFMLGTNVYQFNKGFNFVSRDYEDLDKTEDFITMTMGKGLSNRTASFKGKKYDFRAPIVQMGALYASEVSDKIVVTYNPPGEDTSWHEQKGKYTGFKSGQIVTQVYDRTKIYGFTFTPDSLLIVGGSSGYLKAFNLNGKVVSELFGHEDVVFTVNMSQDEKWILTGSHDQSIRIWDASLVGKQKSLVPTATCFFSNDGEWIVVTDQKYYMSSTKGGKYVGFHQNQGLRKEAKFYPFENFDLKYNRPDKVLEIMGLGSQRLRELLYLAYQKRVKKMGLKEEDISGNINLPEVVMSTVSETVKDKFYEINIQALDKELMLDRINVFVNDIPIYGTGGISVRNEKNRQSISKKIMIELMSGKNKIQVSAMNIAGVESLKETVDVFYDGERPKPDLHVVAIGVSNYKDSQYNLTYASKDANDISNLFFGHHQRFNKIHIHKFTDALAQKELILAVKEKLLKTKIEDEVIVFAAGHGLLDENLDYYFATQDIDFNNPSGRGLKYEELEGLLDGIPARQKLMLIDACHSGEVDKEDTKLIASAVSSSNVSTRGFTKKPQPVGMDNVFELMQELFADLRRGTGAMVISSASGVEFAFESADWKNGVFTYALIEGLKSGKCDTNKDKEVQISELKNYVFDRVEELTNGKQHPTSRRENLEFDFVVW